MDLKFPSTQAERFVIISYLTFLTLFDSCNSFFMFLACLIMIVLHQALMLLYHIKNLGSLLMIEFSCYSRTSQSHPKKAGSLMPPRVCIILFELTSIHKILFGKGKPHIVGWKS